MPYFMNMRPCILAASESSRGSSVGGAVAVIGGAQMLATPAGPCWMAAAGAAGSTRRRLAAGWGSVSSMTACPFA